MFDRLGQALNVLGHLPSGRSLLLLLCIGAALDTAFTLTLQSEYPIATHQERTRWLRPSPLIARPCGARAALRIFSHQPKETISTVSASSDQSATSRMSGLIWLTAGLAGGDAHRT